MNDQAKQHQQLIAKCWADEAFKQRLVADPAGTLKAEGIAVPAGAHVQVVENTAQEFTIVIPAMSTDLSDEFLIGASGGGDQEVPFKELFTPPNPHYKAR